MVTYDPHEAIYYRANNKLVLQYHVQFFGSAVERGWLKPHLLQELKSVDERRVKKGIRKKFQKDYDVAMMEIEQALSMTLKQRKLHFIYDYSQASVGKENDKVIRKRVRRKKEVSSSYITPTFATPIVPTSSFTTPPEHSLADNHPNCIKITLEPIEPCNLQPSLLPPVPMHANGLNVALPFASFQEAPPQPIHPSSSVVSRQTLPCYPPLIPNQSSSRLLSPFKLVTGIRSKQLNDHSIRSSQPPVKHSNSMITNAPFPTKLEDDDLSYNQLTVLTPPFSDIESVDSGMHLHKRKLPNSVDFTDPQKHQKPKKAKATSKIKGECAVCDSDGDVILCNGHCSHAFHVDCLGLVSVPVNFTCDECLTSSALCFVCKEAKLTEETLLCSHANCTKSYHPSCVSSLKTFQVDLQKGKLVCGLHKCAKCTCTDSTSISSSSKLLQCVKCPLALHKSKCLIAGCEVLDDKLMLCYRHVTLSYRLPQSIRHFSMNSCLLCGEVGTLLCCDFCSAAYHYNCLSEEQTSQSDDNSRKWLCPFCATHDLPVYESVVLCKCGNYRLAYYCIV